MNVDTTVQAWVLACRPQLPIQNPLWAFVHNNILLMSEHKPFATAVRDAAALYRARPYESEEFFRRELARGRIDRAALAAVLLARWPAGHAAPHDGDEAIARFLADPQLGDDQPPVPLVPGPSAEHLIRYSVRDRPLQDWLVPLIASYLDQGLAPWPNPYAGTGLWDCFVATVNATPAFGMHWAPQLKARLRRHLDAGRGVLAIVHAEVSEFAAASQAQDYCLQTLFVLKGWSGMVHKLETEPQLAPGEAPKLSLPDWLAIMLVSIHALDDAIRGEHPHHPAPVHSHYTRGLGRLHRWQEAYERSCASQVLATLERDLRQPLPPVGRRAQALVCMDDREETLRRALERPDIGIQTFGTVGFFGIDMRFQALGAARPSRQCPPVVEPSRTIHELPVDEAGRSWARARTAGRLHDSLAIMLYAQSRTLVRGVLVAFAAGLLSFVPLVFKLLLPSRVHRWRRAVRRMVLPRPWTRIDVDAPGGYRPEEQVEIVASILRTTGLVRDFATLVAVVSHGSTTSNNPLRQAYGCGACSGNSGVPNSRLFALLANRTEVRAGLRTRGIEVPTTTLFVPYHHDTTIDTVTLLDEALVPPERLPEARQIGGLLQQAARLTAVERCRRLLPGRAPLSPERAYQHVQDRGHDLAQPRPEYGHNRVAFCIVGRRRCTIRSNLDRRSFLVSYDPTTDPTGAILREAVLGTVPVAVNIAMDYYFSRVDNDGFGCGSKLPLNIASLLGVITGSKSDLRIGLARQQVELHEPMRVTVLMEAPAPRILGLVNGHPRLRRMVEGGWMHLGRIDPDTDAIEMYVDGHFRPWREAWPEASTMAAGATAATLDTAADHVMEGRW
ncbi:MAG: DUF2309 domain-containing protein [Planctomycetes bacterium]|jgi:hypothetical protein|nr:DUF2309 domain-containing protein [Planctomycetota bacterium]